LRKTDGKLTTFEIDQHRASLAKENFAKAGVDKLITQVIGDAHEEVKNLKEPIDVLFIDADKEGYNDYLEKLLPLVKPGGLIVSHNMEMFRGNSPFIKSITGNPELETVFLSVQSGKIAVSMKKR
jgi:caffeoyl-CoA O-methyltransferase